jgi:hypothetical protein
MTMKKNQKRLLTLAVMMAASPLYAASLNEIEANHPINASQYITVNDHVMELSGVIGTISASTTTTTTTTTTTSPLPAPIGMTGMLAPAPAPAAESDLDYYSFYAQAGDVVTVDIDGGIGGAKSVDTILAVFDADHMLQRMNDDASSLDTGSSSTRDSRIDNFKVPKSGVYYVGVSAYPRRFLDGGNVTATGSGSGDYKLLISGVSPAVKQISIEVKPGSRELATLNPKSKGKIPVALLSDTSFNAMDINQATLTFGGKGNEASLSKCNPSGQDVNGDGLLDLICHFDNQAAKFNSESMEGVARGKTRQGVAFEGAGLLKVVPAAYK